MKRNRILLIGALFIVGTLALLSSRFINQNDQSFNFSFASTGAFECAEELGNTCIDTTGKPRCLTPYTELCGPGGQTREITCLPGGEFRAGACSGGTQTPAQISGDDPTRDQCPLATIWNEVEKICKGTAAGTNDETLDQDPVANGGNTVANKAAKPNDPKTLAEANRATDGPLGSTGGSSIPTLTDPDLGEESEATEEAREACREFARNQDSSDLLESFRDPSSTSPVLEISICDSADLESQLLTICNSLDEDARSGCEAIIVDFNNSLVTESTAEETTPGSSAERYCNNIVTEAIRDCSNDVILTNTTISASSFTCSFQVGTAATSNIVKEVSRATSTPSAEEINAICTGERTNSTESDSSDDIDVSVVGEEIEAEPESSLTICEESNLNVSNHNCIQENRILGNYLKLPSLSTKVSAQEAPPIPQSVSLSDLQSGAYQFDISGYSVPEVTIYTDNVSVNFYVDSNNNGRKDPGEELDTNALQVRVSKVREVRNYSFERGWNTMAFPFVNENISSASELVTVLANRRVVAQQISTYDGGKFIHFVARVGVEGDLVTYGTDFDIVPGKGYFVYTPYGGTAPLSGNIFEESVPINLETGWNLASIQSSTRYTATTILESCTVTNILCTQVSRFENGLYDSVVEQNGFFFGNDFPLTDTKGYFIKVDGSGGTFNP